MFVRRPILDRRPVQNLLLVAALVICVVMLVPSLSPVLGDAQTLKALRSSRPWRALTTLGHRTSAAPEVGFGTVPVSKTPVSQRPPVQVKGILLNGYTAGGSRFDNLLGLVKRTELN